MRQFSRVLSLMLMGVLLCSQCYAGFGFCVDAAVDYSDIIFYHDCDAEDNANKSGGSSAVTYDSGILVETSAPILGSGSWDNNNDGYDRIHFLISGNVDTVSGRIGFYFQPKEVASGDEIFFDETAIGTYNGDVKLNRSGTDLTLNWLGATGTTSGLNLTINTDYFIEIKMDGTNAYLYVDGVLEASATGGTGVIGGSYIAIFSKDGDAWDSWVDQVISSNDVDRDLNAIKDVTDFS